MQTVYFDNSATTRPSAAAIAEMTRTLESAWGNPSSTHSMGCEAHSALLLARRRVLSALGIKATDAKEENLIFCSGGTEADNLAILGCARAKRALRGGKLITTDSEHPAVLRPMSALEKEGFRVAYLPTRGGVVDMEVLAREMTADTFFVSVMLVNNETGAVNDVRAISDFVKSVNSECIVHTDAVQGFLKMPFSPQSLGADLVTVSSHKIHGPKGVGALYVSPYLVKRRALSPILFGGDQEGGIRSGTENLPGIAGFGAAAEEGHRRLSEHIAHMTELRSYLIEAMQADRVLSSVAVNQPQTPMTAPHILSIRLPAIKSETMLNYLSGRGIAVSAGSACAAQSGRVSPTLLKFGLRESEADATLRISLCVDNTKEEADLFLESLRTGVSMLARMKR